MKKVAVLIPCYNEEKTIVNVIMDVEEKLPNADIYVYDNNSDDATVKLANALGVNIGHESKRGKGNVVRTMLEEVEADCYIMLDGDYTYNIESIETMVDKVLNKGVDLVLGSRLTSDYFKKNQKFLHSAGNKFLTKVIKYLYNVPNIDMLTGFRAMSNDFVKSFNPKSENFEIETEMTLFALSNNFKIDSVHSEYRLRPRGSYSKINFIKDGFSILRTIAKHIVHQKRK